MSNNFSTYPGRFPCKTCKEEVKTIRIYKNTGMGTWMCSKKHLSEVKVFQVGYKKKKDYEREERE
jgi:hypothetical protein